MIETVHAYYPTRDRFLEAIEAALSPRRVVLLSSQEELAEEMPRIEAIVVRRPPRGLWAEGRKLRLVQMIGAGVDSVLPAPDLAETVALANGRGVAPPAMSEFGLGMILTLLKGVPKALEQQARKEWRRWMPRSLSGRTVGILGLGAIGLALAEKVHFLGARVIATQRQPKSYPAVTQVFPPEKADEVLGQADVLVVLLPLTESTRGSIDSAALAALKSGSYLVNMARGGIVDEVALIAALESGHLAAAAVDVFEQEPLPSDSPLWEARNILITPHLAGLFEQYSERLAELFADNVERIEQGKEIRNLIPRDRGY